MNPAGRRMLMTGTWVVLAGTIGIAVSHVFGQSYDGYGNPIPPPPLGSPPATVEAPAVNVARPATPQATMPQTAPATNSASKTPPFAYFRNRNSQSSNRQPAPQSGVKSRPITQVSGTQDGNSSGVQHADAISVYTGPPSKAPPGSQTARKGVVTPAGHIDSLHDPNSDPSLGPPPDPVARPFLLSRPSAPPPVSNAPASNGAFPTDRQVPPTIRGTHLGLQPGETATERSMRLMTAVADLERQLEGVGLRNAELNELVRQRDDQLLLAIREIKSVRKDVSAAKDELERLREQVKNLQEKVVAAERDNTALLQTMAPLLYQLLNTDASSTEDTEQ